MSNRIKQGKTAKVSKNKPDKPPQKVSFRFDKITTNNKYGIGYHKDKTEKLKMMEDMMEKLSEVSNYSLRDLYVKGAIQGCESIPYANFHENAQRAFNGSGIVSRDSKLIVFRFCQNKYRMICKVYPDDTSTLCVLGFDFDYSAYPHS